MKWQIQREAELTHTLDVRTCVYIHQLSVRTNTHSDKRKYTVHTHRHTYTGVKEKTGCTQIQEQSVHFIQKNSFITWKSPWRTQDSLSCCVCFLCSAEGSCALSSENTTSTHCSVSIPPRFHVILRHFFLLRVATVFSHYYELQHQLLQEKLISFCHKTYFYRTRLFLSL